MNLSKESAVKALTGYDNVSGERSVLQGMACTNDQNEFKIFQNPVDIYSFQINYVQSFFKFRKIKILFAKAYERKSHWAEHSITKLKSTDGNCVVYKKVLSDHQGLGN